MPSLPPCNIAPLTGNYNQIKISYHLKTMNLAQTIYQKSLALTPEKAQAVIDFIDFIQTRPSLVTEETTEASNQTEPKLSFSERWRGKFSS